MVQTGQSACVSTNEGEGMTNAIRRHPVRLLTFAAVVTALLGALVATEAQAALRHFEGTVVSKNADRHTFRTRTENGNRVRFHVNRSTEFERIPGGFKGLKRGLRVQVDARRTDRGLLAKHVEKHRRGGGGAAEDGPNHG
jgi:hypothetical protein